MKQLPGTIEVIVYYLLIALCISGFIYLMAEIIMMGE